MIYLSLSLIFFTLGLLREKGLAPFLLLISCLPFANSLASYFYKFGLYSYDFFFFGLIVAVSTRGILRGPKKIHIQRWSTALLATIIVYSVVALASGTKIDVYFLRDYRPAVFAIELLAAALILKSENLHLSNQKALLIAILAGSTNLFWLSLSIAGIISSDDEYYTTNNYKYFDASTYISALFIINFLAQRRQNEQQIQRSDSRGMQVIAFGVSLLSVIFSGYRALILATVIASVVTSIRSPKKLALALVVLPLSVVTFLYISTYFGATRVIEGLTLSGIQSQLTTRYGPALDVISSFSPVNYIFGKGFGTVFVIDWFEYRSLDTANNFVDSAYITFFAKYGVIGLLLLLSMVFSLRAISEKPLKNPLTAYLLTLFIVYAISYQPASAGLIAGCLLIKSHSRKTPNPIEYEK